MYKRQALVCEPRLLILDEPTTALDVTVAKQILDLVLSLRDRFGFGVMLITHNPVSYTHLDVYKRQP